MKKLLFLSVATAIVASVFLSCKDKDEEYQDDIIWDFNPIVFSILVKDANGANALTSMDLSRISARWRDSSYFCHPLTREYMPSFYGLGIVNDSILLFGELDGSADIRNEKVILDWGDGSKQDTLTFQLYRGWINKRTPVDYVREYRLNGELVPRLPFVIIK